MQTKKIKTVTGYKALARILAELGVSDCSMDGDVLRECPVLKGFPVTRYSYTGNTVAYWKGYQGRYFAWPEISHRKYEIHELIA